MMSTITRRETAAQFAALGIEGEALKCLLWETAPARHASRVSAARVAAEEYYLTSSRLERDDVCEEMLTIAAGVILWADVIGVGGPDGVAGYATLRHPAFAECGKGRKHATDGSAWSAAIHDAARECNVEFTVNENGVLCAISSSGEMMVDEFTVPARWRVSIVREGLRRAAGLSPWHPNAPFKSPAESLPAWAAVLNSSLEQAALLAQ